MATPGQDRAVSNDGRMYGPPPDFTPNGFHPELNHSYQKQPPPFDNTDPMLRARSRSPMNHPPPMASTAADSRFMYDQMRHSQYASRFGPALAPPTPIPVASPHQDYFASELTQEVNELRGRQRDYAALQDQFRYLQEQYKNIQFEKQQFESDCLNKISTDRQEVDLLIRELDQVRAENYQCEDEQLRLMEQINVTEKEVAGASMELSDIRHECSAQDMNNLNLRKEVEYNEKLLCEQKDIASQNYQELNRMREISFNLDKDIDAQRKRIDILRCEIENNEQRIASINDLLNSKDEAISRTQFQIGEALQQIQDLKYTLNKLDGELGYFENQNEQHKAAQGQMFKANEYEYMQGKDNNLKVQELEITLNKLVADEKSVSYEIDRLKQHSDQMLKDQIDLQAEIDALDKHMANLNNQNYCLQKELEEFVQADDQVRRNLDRKAKVDNIRQRVDDVIARSQAEVEHQRREREMHVQEEKFAAQERFGRMEQIDRVERERARSANAYSPSRGGPDFRRQAWGPVPPEEEMIGNQMSFGRDKYEREARLSMEAEAMHPDYRRRGGSPLRGPSPRSVHFA